MTTIIRNSYAAKQRHSSAKLLNREKNGGHLQFSNANLWRHSAVYSLIRVK